MTWRMAKDECEPGLTAIIECGRADDYGAIEAKLERLISFHSDLIIAAAQRLPRWVEEQMISEDEVTPLAKVLTVAENRGLFRSGSTSTICRVSHLLSESDLDWLYRHASNPYVPFGSNGRCRKAPTVNAYRKCEEVMRLEKELAKAQRQFKLAKKRFHGNVRLEAMRKAQAERTALRNDLMEKLRTSPVGERLAAIMGSTRPIHYFPEEFAEVPRETISGLSLEVLWGLADKLVRAKKGPWRRLFKILSFYTPCQTSRNRKGQTP